MNIKIAITEMYPRILWEMVADPLAPAGHILGTTVIDQSTFSLQDPKSGPWYVTNQTLHTNLGITLVDDEIGRLATSYYKHLPTHSNDSFYHSSHA